ncbi:MAG: hypothetical protein EXQ88_03020 [Alphaproteobacteria bacterium]|nr:hypothetical protein [Alphaproteobacteria bacterium]
MATSDQDEAAAAGKPAADRPATVTIDGRFEVQLGARLPEMCGPTAEAFIASDSKTASSTLVALVIDPRLPARQAIASQIERRAPEGILRPVFRGVAAWPGGDRFVIIVEHPPGVRLAPPLGEAFTPFTIERLLAEVAFPIRRILEKLAELRIAHRAIRADNLFYGPGGLGTLVMGECYSAPPGYTQPSIYEPVSRALAMPSGRGQGGAPTICSPSA